MESSMVDCHCHLAATEFKEDLENLLSEAKQIGVSQIVAVSEFVNDFEPIIALSQRFAGLVFPSLGVHPVQIGDRSVTLKDFAEAEEYIKRYQNQLVAIGEIGLDFTPRYIKSSSDKDIQRECFAKQIRLSMEMDLPVNVHSRSAGRPVIDMLIKEGAKNVVLHAFDGKVSNALRGVEAGYYFSVPPCIVRSEQKQKLVKAIPMEIYFWKQMHQP